MSPDATARAANLTADDLRQAHSTPQTRASQIAALEAGSSAAADRSAAVTLSPAQMAEQRRAGQSAASGSLNAGLSNNSGATAPEWKVPATSELADLTADLDGPNSLQPSKAARARMAAAIDSRPACIFECSGSGSNGNGTGLDARRAPGGPIRIGSAG